MYNYIRSCLSFGTLRQFYRYIISGVLSAAIEYLFIIVLTEYMGLWYIASNTIGMTGGFCLGFFLNRYWSFKSNKSFVHQFFLYGTLFLINLILSNALLYFLTNIVHIKYTISKLFAMGLIVMWNFIIYKKLIFKY
ncbi:MAG TPA: GtrA family protein [Clostridiaceae bacterium]|nr:GtrA family protein [Clostridiaceae bacterium]